MTSEDEETISEARPSLAAIVRRALPHALPVMLGYLSIGIPCGIMEAEIGVSPLFAFLISLAFYTGSGQFMIANMVLAGLPAYSIVLAVILVSTRQLLYSAAYAPYFASVRKALALFFSATVTDETFGVNMDRYAQDPSWTAEDATAVNCLSRLSWASANCLGALVGSMVDIPTDISSFAMTSIFICLLVSQGASRQNVVVTAVAFASVLLLKLVGLGHISVLVGAILAVVCGFAVMGGGQHAS